MSGLKKLIHEIHRRSLWQVLSVYAVGSFVVLQVLDALGDTVGLPGWFASFAIGLLLIGVPIVLATAFVQEGVRVQRPARPFSDDEPGTVPSSEPVTDVLPTRAEGSPEPRPTSKRLFTWRNAILGGGAAFALLGVGTASYMAMRTLGIGPAATLVAAGTLDERATILVAEFEGADSLLARAATEALRIDLGESETVQLAGTILDGVSSAVATEHRTRQPAPSCPGEGQRFLGRKR